MLPLLADENFNFRIVQGVFRQEPQVDLLRVQEVGLTGQSDPAVLEWAAAQGRALLTHDVNTMRAFASQRVTAGQRMPGLLLVRDSRPDLGRVIEDIVLLSQCYAAGDLEGQELFLPLS